jgi:sugar lactone lactonase YvrE
VSVAKPLFASRNFSGVMRRPFALSEEKSRRVGLRALCLFGMVCFAGLLATTSLAQVQFGGRQDTVGSVPIPDAVALDSSGNVYVADVGSGSIYKIDPFGNQAGVGGATGLWAVAVDSAGNIYYTNFGNNCVEELPVGGGGPVCLGTGLSGPVGIAVDETGNLYVADSGNGRVVEIAAGGGQSTLATGFSSVYSVAVDKAGNVYVADSSATSITEILVGGSTTTLGSGLTGPQGVAVDPDGDVYVSQSNDAVAMVTVSGAQTTLPITGLSNPLILAVDANFNLYIPNRNNGTVVIFNAHAAAMGWAYACVNGNTSPCGQTATINVAIAGDEFGGVSTVTYGANGKGGDFTIPVGGNTCIGTTSPCTVTVEFQAQEPGPRSGALLITDATTGNTVAFPLYGVGWGADAGFSPPSTLPPVHSDGLQYPAAVAVDGGGVANGNIYIADDQSEAVWVTDAYNDYFTLFAGNYTAGYSGDGGPAASMAELSNPQDVAVDSAGDVYIADEGNNVIRKVDVNENISTVAGVQALGSGYGGDGGPATSAQLNEPYGIALDAAGNLYIADTANNRIRKVDLAGIITTVAGNGTLGYSGDSGPATSAELSHPFGVRVDSNANLFIADSGNNVVRKVDPAGTISTVAGNYTMGSGESGDGGPATSAQLAFPILVSADAADELFITDGDGVVRRVDSAGTISTYSTSTQDISDAVVDPTGNLAMVDPDVEELTTYERTIPAGVSFGNQAINTPSAPLDVTVTNIGNLELDFSAITPDTGFNLDGPDTSCSTDAGVGVGLDCILGIEFDPPTADNFETTVALTDNSLGTAGSSMQNVGVTGTGVTLTTTTTGLTAAPNPANAGASVTLSAKVSPAPTGSPLGSISFTDGATLLSSVDIDSSGAASLATSSLSVGSHTITAVYSGNAAFATSTSTAVTEVINAPTTTTTVSAAPNPATVGQSITLSASVSPTPTGSPLGSINFMDGATLLSTVNINSFGAATYATSSLAAGSHTLTAVYSGNAGFASSISTAVTEVVNAATTTTATTTTVTTSPNPGYDGSTVTLTATVSPGPTGSSLGTVTFCDAGAGPDIARRVNRSIATSRPGRTATSQAEVDSRPCGSDTELGTASLNSQGTATLTLTTLTVGGHGIYAVYSGNSGFATSTSSNVVETIGAAYTVTAPQTPVDVSEGGAVDVTVTVPPLGGAFNSPVTLSASGLPPGAQATFNPPTVTPGAAGEQTMMTIQLAKTSTAGPSSEPMGPAGIYRTAGFAALALLLFGLAARRRRLAGLAAVLLAVSLVSAAAALSGCNGGFAGLSTRPGQYSITITGTSGALHASTQVTVVVQ